MPTCLDRRELCRLIGVDVIAVEVAEEQLDRNENGREVKAIRSMTWASARNLRRSRYHAPAAVAQKAPVRKDARSICGKRTQTTGLKMILAQSLGAKTPFSKASPVGTCIQLLFIMIQ